MKKNKMKEVAKIIGVEIGKPFKIKGYEEEKILTNNCLINNQGETQTSVLIGLLNGNYEVDKEKLLTERERKYLENLLKPFKDEVKRILKESTANKKYEWLSIVIDGCRWRLNLPFFEKDKYYECMEIGKDYSLKELGLFEED